MSMSHLKCIRCSKTHEQKDIYLCTECSGILEVIHDYQLMRNRMIKAIQSPLSSNIWRYKSLLPVGDSKFMVSLSEGGTPLIKCENISAKLEFSNIYFKDESRNPSGAFKDRPIAVGVSKAKEFKREVVTTASSGNAAAALATYSARAGIKSYIFVPEHTPTEKVTQALVNGGNIIKVRGSYSNAYSTAQQAARRFEWMNLTTTFLNPYAIEGDKTVAYELYTQLHGSVPDWILVPTGAGPLLFGIYKGFLELVELGLTEKSPKMVAVQAEGCAPIVEAFESGSRSVRGWGIPHTVASAIADPLNGYEQDGELVLQIVRESGGIAVSVSDEKIVESVFELAGNEGIYAEPAAAASYAGLKKLIQHGSIAGSDTAVCIITGHGLKDPTSVVKTLNVPIIEPNVEALEKIIA